ncbi:MAG: THUMP domain-containing protein [Thermoplasmata archaeon]|nr:THUMP domain-containing protein [Thermoplasmata archaeon]
MPALFLVRYGELALKSPPVRREFEQTLRRNILDQFVAAGALCRLRSDHGHFYVETDEREPAVSILSRVFGVTSVSEAVEIPTERAAITSGVLAMGDGRLTPGRSFAVRARRTGQHPFTSQELARDLGGDILERWPDRQLHVDLDHPEVELFVEVRGPRTYLYTDRRRGPGGLPLGVAGRVVALVDGPRGALGAYLMMKRGCRCAVVAVTDPAAEPLRTLARFDPKALVRAGGPDADATLHLLADETKADGVVLPLAIDDYPDAKLRWGERVVFSPTVGLTDEEVRGRWQGVEELAA